MGYHLEDMVNYLKYLITLFNKLLLIILMIHLLLIILMIVLRMSSCWHPLWQLLLLCIHRNQTAPECRGDTQTCSSDQIPDPDCSTEHCPPDTSDHQFRSHWLSLAPATLLCNMSTLLKYSTVCPPKLRLNLWGVFFMGHPVSSVNTHVIFWPNLSLAWPTATVNPLISILDNSVSCIHWNNQSYILSLK